MAYSGVSENEVTDSEVARWVTEIKLYEKEAENWTKRAKKIVKRYKDERKDTVTTGARYNILYSNVQTLLPAYFSRSPKPDIQRRFKDDDDLGRITADVLERCTNYFVDTDKFKESVKKAVFDRLVPGRGVTWVRYVPHMQDIQVTGNDEVKQEGAQITEDVYSELQEVTHEEVCTDYVYWEDFGHTVARNEDEIRAKWRKVYLSRDEMTERFGKDIAKEVPLDYSPKNLSDEKISDDMKKATIYEIWDKPSKTAKWLHKDVSQLLDEKDDPLKLEDFFPCPRALTPTLTNDTTIPVPDYIQYQDQARELDELTGRIASITKALKVAGVYDASAAGLDRLLTEGIENILIPIEQWAVFGEKGLRGVIDFLPMKEIMDTLLGLYEARDKVKSDLYEITGLADIIRGGSNPQETATAQKIKGNFATLRLDEGQQEVQRFARDLVRIIAQIIANHFGLETIKSISGIKLMTDMEKQQFQMQRQQMEQQAQQMAAQQPDIEPQPLAPIPDDVQELLDNPTWEQVYALLKNEAMRSFRIDIETDSTIKEDQQAQQQATTEFLSAAGGFLQQAMPIAQSDPDIAPLLMEMLMDGVRTFKAGKSLESAFELYQRKLQKKAENPQPPPPNPEMMKVQGQLQMQQQKQQADQQAAQQKMQAEQQLAAMKMDAESQHTAQKMQGEQQLEAMRAHNDHQLEIARTAKEMEMEREIAMLRLQLEEKAMKQQEDE